MHRCVPLDVEVLTKRGWRTYDELQEGDETPGLNWDTGETEWTPILGRNRYDDAEVVETGSRKWSARSTSGHKWVARHPQTGNYHWVTTGSRQQHPWVVAAPMADGPSVDVTEDEAELLGWLLTDGSQWEGGTPCAFNGCLNTATGHGLCGSHRRQQRQGKALHPLRASNRPQRPGFSMFVWQIKPEGVKRLKAILGNKASSNGKGYRLRDAYARDLLQRAALTHIKKADELLALMAKMSGKQRQAMLRGVIGGDGTAHGRRVLQNDGPLVGVIATLAYYCGKRVRVTKRSMTDNGWHRTGVPVAISLSRPRVSTYRQERRPVGRMAVWCPTTALGTWTARFHGNPVITGDCQAP